MRVEQMINHIGHYSVKNYVIEHKDILYMQSYGEIVAFKANNIIFINEDSFRKSPTTHRYMKYFIERYGHTEVVGLTDEVFKTMEEKL